MGEEVTHKFQSSFRNWLNFHVKDIKIFLKSATKKPQFKIYFSIIVCCLKKKCPHVFMHITIF